MQEPDAPDVVISESGAAGDVFATGVLPPEDCGEYIRLTPYVDRAAPDGRLAGLRLEGIWMHVGTPEAVAAAEAAMRASTG